MPKHRRDPMRSEIAAAETMLAKIKAAAVGPLDLPSQLVNTADFCHNEGDAELVREMNQENSEEAGRCIMSAIKNGDSKLIRNIADEIDRRRDAPVRDEIAVAMLIHVNRIKGPLTMRELKWEIQGSEDPLLLNMEDRQIRTIVKSLGFQFEGKSGRPKK